MNKRLITSIVTFFLPIIAGAAQAEECVAAVRALVPWATVNNIPTTGNGLGAYTMKASAQKNGNTVNNSAANCSDANPCILVYPPDYGSYIPIETGHVAVLRSDKNSDGTYALTDSNGVCKGYRASCNKYVDLSKAAVIHPKSELTTSAVAGNEQRVCVTSDIQPLARAALKDKAAGVTFGYLCEPYIQTGLGLHAHAGVDLKATVGTPVYAVADGEVVSVLIWAK